MKKLLLPGTIFAITSVILATITAIIPPKIDNVALLIVVFGLIYSIGFSLIYTIGIMFIDDTGKRLTVSATLGLAVPASFVFFSLKQANIFEISLVILTVCTITWYLAFKK